MDSQTDPLEVWTVATFNVVVFGLVLIILGHQAGVLADALADLGTLSGLLVFSYLWTLVAVMTWWALVNGGLTRSTRGQSFALLLRGLAAGAVIGLGFILGLIVGGSFVGLVTGRIEPTQLVLLASFGSVVGGIGGALVGGVFVFVDVLLYRAMGWFNPWFQLDGELP